VPPYHRVKFSVVSMFRDLIDATTASYDTYTGTGVFCNGSHFVHHCQFDAWCSIENLWSIERECDDAGASLYLYKRTIVSLS